MASVLQSIGALLQIGDRPSRGPSHSFGKAHLIMAFMTVGESGTIGRQMLAARSGLTEGPARTIIKKLREDGYLDINASGCRLTKVGERAYKILCSRLTSIIPLEGSDLTIGLRQVGLAVRGGGKSVQGGLEQRDSAIKLGASGATTFVFKDGKFTIPGGSADCEKEFPSKAWPALRKELRPKNGDAVVVAGAQDETTAKLGALTAALTLF